LEHYQKVLLVFFVNHAALTDHLPQCRLGRGQVKRNDETVEGLILFGCRCKSLEKVRRNYQEQVVLFRSVVNGLDLDLG
jgi:hypothetical protein